MGEVAVSLKGVSKCYKRYAHPADRLKEILLPHKNRAEEFWALRDIDLEIYRGETLGIIGENGSGKSTMLQIIAGTLTPTAGQVNVHGRISALLELGSGFNPEFTGRQNVFFNGRVLGLTQAEVEQKFSQIEAFADIGDFIDQPVKTYSSGMFVRLAFAVAIHVDPEILIVDEALAVGDIFFQQKCFKALETIRDRGASIIFVSHDPQTLVKLCDRAVILQHGHLKYAGSPADMVAKYTEIHHTRNSPEIIQRSQVSESTSESIADEHGLASVPVEFASNFSEEQRYGSYTGLIAGVLTSDEKGEPKSFFETDETIFLSIKINSHPIELCPLNIGFQIKNRLGQTVVATNTCLLGLPIRESLFKESFICQFCFKLPVYPGTYSFSVAVAEHDRNAQVIYDWIERAGIIDVVAAGPLTQAGLFFTDVVVKES